VDLRPIQRRELGLDWPGLDGIESAPIGTMWRDTMTRILAAIGFCAFILLSGTAVSAGAKAAEPATAVTPPPRAQQATESRTVLSTTAPPRPAVVASRESVSTHRAGARA
jgi:hypothetical protein